MITEESDQELRAIVIDRLEQYAALNGGWRGALEGLEALIQVDAKLQQHAAGGAVH